MFVPPVRRIVRNIAKTILFYREQKKKKTKINKKKKSALIDEPFDSHQNAMVSCLIRS